MQQGSDFNPYAPPTEQADRGEWVPNDSLRVLATPGQRWLGATLDGVFYLVAVVPPLLLGELAKDSAGLVIGGSMLLTLLPLVIYQTVITAKTGQSLGKKIVKTRIVKLDGSQPGFMHGVFLRSWVFGVLTAIPYLGSLLSLVDVLMILRSDRRMLHDQMAGTQVIQQL